MASCQPSNAALFSVLRFFLLCPMSLPSISSAFDGESAALISAHLVVDTPMYVNRSL